MKHVHVHLIPRRKGDWPRNDDIYNDIHDGERESKQDSEMHVDNEDRKPRSIEEMEQEARELALLFTD